MLDDKDIDAVVIATPNHWHALATIWALQAGKHVYVEKPSSHTVWEGRKMVEATARYNKIVQVGTMNRSRPAVRDAIKFIHEGGLGKIYMARGLCYKPRPSIGKYPDGPMAPGEKYALTVTSTTIEPTYDEQYLSKVDYDLWLGPAPKRPFNRNRFHYNWHWHWDYGNGDSGNQGPHQFDIARWGLQKQEHPVKIRSVGGYFGAEASQETPDTQTTPVRVRRRRRARVRHARRLHERRRRREDRQPVLRLEGLALDRGDAAGSGSPTSDRRTRRVRAPRRRPEPSSEPTGLTTTEYPHYQNFIDAIRAGDPKVLTCDVLEGHLSSSLPHLGNISYRVGRALTFDGKAEKFVDDKQADRLLTREYRKGFEIPSSFGVGSNDQARR